MIQIKICGTSTIKVMIYVPVVSTDKKKKRYLPFPAIILMPAQPMYTVWAGGIHLNCLSLGYRLKVIYCDEGQEVNRKDLCELYVWWLGNSKYKARLLACADEGHFVPSECIVATRKYLVFKICGRILSSISENTKLQFEIHRHRICTHFIWKCVSECLNKSWYL